MFDQEVTSGVLAKLGAQLKAHPENQLPSLEQVEDVVYYQRKAFPFVNSVSYIHWLFY
jgi:hypothetical protein